jgi:hypothetical protein
MKTEKEFKDALYKEGVQLFSNIATDLNKISDTFIRTEDGTHRREEDWKEVCIALVLLKRKLANED